MNPKYVLLALGTFFLGFIVGSVTFSDRPAPAPLVYEMPTRVDVNGIGWTLEQVNGFEGMSSLQGLTECNTRHIFISVKSLSIKAVVMHELTHAMVCVDSGGDFTLNNLYFNSQTNSGHEGIYKFTDMWAEMLSRNPDLRNWLAQK